MDQRVMAEIEKVIAHPEGAFGRIRDLEAKRGSTLVCPGAYLPFIFPKDDWHNLFLYVGALLMGVFWGREI